MGVYKRKDTGVWEIKFQIKGEKYYRSVPEARNKPQARIAEATMRREIYEGRYGRDGQELGSTDFVRFCREVYLPSIKDRLRQWRTREYTLDMLCAYFRGKRLRDITPMLIEGFRRRRLSEHTQYKRLRRPCTVKMEITVLSSIFALAQDNDLIGLNPCRKLRWKREETRSRRERVLDHDEEKRLMLALTSYPEAHAAATLALNTGLRRMEILNLRSIDIDVTGNKLSVIGKGGKRRVVPLNPIAQQTLRQLLSTPTVEGFLFHSRTGNTLSHKQGGFQAAVKTAKIMDLHFHDLRHTFSTRLRQHTDAFTLKEMLGHSQIQTTEGYVTPPLADMQRAVNALAEDSGRVVPFPRAQQA